MEFFMKLFKAFLFLASPWFYNQLTAAAQQPVTAEVETTNITQEPLQEILYASGASSVLAKEFLVQVGHYMANHLTNTNLEDHKELANDYRSLIATLSETSLLTGSIFDMYLRYGTIEKIEFDFSRIRIDIIHEAYDMTTLEKIVTKTAFFLSFGFAWGSYEQGIDSCDLRISINSSPVVERNHHGGNIIWEYDQQAKQWRDASQDA
jgi:hypothetical protein